MDGSSHRLIWKYDILTPNYLAVFDSLLFLVHARYQSIESVDLQNRARGRFYRFRPEGNLMVTERFLAHYKNELYWVGQPEHVRDESVLKIQVRQSPSDYKIHATSKFTRITGLTIYAADSQVQTRRNNCEGQRCAGVCLLSGTDSFRCMCYHGSELDSDGFSCRARTLSDVS